LKYAPYKLKSFHEQNPNQDGPPAKLPDWLAAYEAGIDDYDYLDNDTPVIIRKIQGRERGRPRKAE
jgi:hypothetical protein